MAPRSEQSYSRFRLRLQWRQEKNETCMTKISVENLTFFLTLWNIPGTSIHLYSLSYCFGSLAQLSKLCSTFRKSKYFTSPYFDPPAVVAYLYDWDTDLKGQLAGRESGFLLLQEFFKKSMKKVAEIPNFSKSHWKMSLRFQKSPFCHWFLF